MGEEVRRRDEKGREGANPLQTSRKGRERWGKEKREDAE